MTAMLNAVVGCVLLASVLSLCQGNVDFLFVCVCVSICLVVRSAE